MNTMMYMSPADEAFETIEAACHQEERGYRVIDYLSELSQQVKCRGPLHLLPVDESCRTTMVEWCNNLVGFCEYDRETTASAISCLDRFMSTEEGFQTLFDRDQFQLAVMSAFYTTAKIHERQALEPDSISKLSRRKHSVNAVEAMERRMLNALQWRVNPPTAFAFANMYIDTVPVHMMDDISRQGILDLARYQLDLALTNYRLSLQKKSSLALAAVLNAIDSRDSEFCRFMESSVGKIVISDKDILANSLWDIRRGLYDVIGRQSRTGPMQAALSPKSQPKVSHHNSPRSIVSMHHLDSPRMVSSNLL